MVITPPTPLPRNSSQLEEAEQTLIARLQLLSAAHDVLTHESWEGATLAEIAEGALQPFRQKNGWRFKIGGPQVRLLLRQALAFVMALHELATNAVKYGALSNHDGWVILQWDIVDGSKPDHLWLRWEKIGGPPVVPPQRRGFGSRMIERALASELDGTAEIDYRPRGLLCTVEAPLLDKSSLIQGFKITPGSAGALPLCGYVTALTLRRQRALTYSVAHGHYLPRRS